MTVLVVAEAAIITLLAILAIGLIRKNADLLSRLHDVDAAAGTAESATVARDIVGVGLNGRVVGVRVREPDRPTLLAFMSTTCATCSHFWKRFGEARAIATLGKIRLIIVTHGEGYEVPADVAAVAPESIPLVMSSIAWQTYGVPGSPYFVKIAETTGLITAKGSAPDWDGLLDLVGAGSGPASPDAPGASS